MKAKTSLTTVLLLSLSMLAMGIVGALVELYAAIYVGLALYGDYTIFVMASPIGYALLIGGAVVGASIPLVIRSAWKHFRRSHAA